MYFCNKRYEEIGETDKNKKDIVTEEWRKMTSAEKDKLKEEIKKANDKYEDDLEEWKKKYQTKKSKSKKKHDDDDDTKPEKSKGDRKNKSADKKKDEKAKSKNKKWTHDSSLFINSEFNHINKDCNSWNRAVKLDVNYDLINAFLSIEDNNKNNIAWIELAHWPIMLLLLVRPAK